MRSFEYTWVEFGSGLYTYAGLVALAGSDSTSEWTAVGERIRARKPRTWRWRTSTIWASSMVFAMTEPDTEYTDDVDESSSSESDIDDEDALLAAAGAAGRGMGDAVLASMDPEYDECEWESEHDTECECVDTHDCDDTHDASDAADSFSTLVVAMAPWWCE